MGLASLIGRIIGVNAGYAPGAPVWEYREPLGDDWPALYAFTNYTLQPTDPVLGLAGQMPCHFISARQGGLDRLDPNGNSQVPLILWEPAGSLESTMLGTDPYGVDATNAYSDGSQEFGSG